MIDKSHHRPAKAAAAEVKAGWLASTGLAGAQSCVTPRSSLVTRFIFELLPQTARSRSKGPGVRRETSAATQSRPSPLALRLSVSAG